MSESCKVSIILPIYNMAPCLRETIDSLVNQTFRDIEFICINDGSTDNSLEMLKSYERDDDRFVVYDQQNRGQALTRNFGLSVASGEYVLLLDADDVYEESFVKKMVDRAEETGADIVVCRSLEYDDKTEAIRDAPYAVKIDQVPVTDPFSVHDMKDCIFTAFSGWAWDKLYRRSFIEKHSLVFPDLHNSEDLYFVYLSLVQAQKISLVDEELVLHRVDREGSVSNSREKSPLAFYESLCMLKRELLHKVDFYEELSWGFLNWAFDYTLWNIESIADVDIKKSVLQKLLDGDFVDLELDARAMSYFSLVPCVYERLLKLYRQYISGTYVESFNQTVVEGDEKDAEELFKEEIIPRGSIYFTPTDHDAPIKSTMYDSDEPCASVVVPCYNVQDYVRETLDSLIGQTLHNIEIICVNDGSTDGTLDILNEYASCDDRIKVIDKENGGYGSAMNAGMAAARGEYIGIVESDDFVKEDMFKTLYKAAKKNHLDFVKSDFIKFWTLEDGSIETQYEWLAPDSYYYNKILNPRLDSTLFNVQMLNWTGIYKRDFIEKFNIRHDESPGASYQDNGFWFQVFCHGRRMMILDKAFYYYRQDNAASSINQSNKVFSMLDEYAWIRALLKEDSELEEQFIGIYQYKKMHNCDFAFSLLAPEFQHAFMERYSEEYREANESGELNRGLFYPEEWNRIQFIINDPEGYIEDYNQKQAAIVEQEAYNNARERGKLALAAFVLKKYGVMKLMKKTAAYIKNRIINK